MPVRFVLLLALCAASHGCKPFSDPQTVYDQIARKMNQGDLGGALLDVNRAYQRYGTKNVEWDWRFRVLKAQILISQSAPREALTLLNGELPPSLSTKDVAVRKVLFEGIAHRYAQEFERSEKKLKEAELLAASSQPQLSSQVLNAMGALEVDEHKYSSAEVTFRRALSLARQQKNQLQEASALGNLARLLTKEEHFDEAIDLNHAALQLARFLNSQSLVTTILGNMGWNYFQMGDFENSLTFYKQAEEASQKSALTGYGAYWLTGIANVHYVNHEYESAEKVSLRALEVARRIDDKKTITECLNDLSAVALETGRVEIAEQYNKEALDIERAGLDQTGILYSQLMNARIQSSKGHFSEAERLFQGIIQSPKADTPLKWEAEARLAKAYDDEGKAADAEEEYQKAIETIETARKSLKRDEFRLTFLSSAIEFYEDYVDFLVAHGRPNDALNVAELSRARTLAEGLGLANEAVSISTRDVRPQQIARNLKASLLFYWVGHNHSYLWVITAARTAYFMLPKASDIGALVKSYRKVLSGLHDAQDAGSSDGKQLYAMLVEPGERLIPQGSRVIVLPSESLYGLNFETLIVPDPQPHFWIEDVTLTTASSLTLLGSSTLRPATEQKSLLLVGNTEPPGTDFPALSQAQAEMKQVEQYFPETRRRVLEGKTATPTAYLNSNPERFAYLHFVTHGTASRTRPLESAVILSKEGDSYKLYARDIVQHRLNANLVTISACNGAGTRAYSGEGLVGLSWAFLRAGAHNVIGALWEVSDASTPQLMDALYSRLSQGKNPATALRDAKLSMLHSKSNTVFKKPFYWAPFQLYAGS